MSAKDIFHPVSPFDIPQVADMLARAFFDDPLYLHLFQNEKERVMRVKALFEMRLAYAIKWGDVYATSPRLEGVAVLLPMPEAEPSADRLFRVTSVSRCVRVGLKNLAILATYEQYARRLRSRHAPKRYLYLSPMAVRADCRGRGLGGALLEEAQRRSGDRGAVVLETQSERNAEFYGKRGFEVIAKGRLPGSGVGHWLMRG